VCRPEVPWLILRCSISRARVRVFLRLALSVTCHGYSIDNAERQTTSVIVPSMLGVDRAGVTAPIDPSKAIGKHLMPS
jgi:hypothetical protein